MLNERVSLAREWMKEQGVDVIVAFNDGQNSFLDSNSVYVFTRFRSIGESVAVISREGEVVLIMTPAYDGERALAMSSADRVVAADDLVSGLRMELAAAHRSAEIASVALTKQRRALAEQAQEILGGRTRDAGDLASHLARIRTRRELAAVRRAASIAEHGYRRLKETVRSGMREFELAAEIYCHMKELGAEDNFLLMSSSQHNLAVRAAGRRTLEPGDVILAEITPCFDGQFVQICRTVVIGSIPAVMTEKYDLLRRAMARGMAAATPGATASQATAAMNACFREAGYGDYCKPPYMRVRGHGLGITSDRPGNLDGVNETQFEEGMVFVMHPNQYLPETGYLMCGETVVVSRDGAASLSEADAVLESVAG